MPENKLEILEEHYPEGISWQGARYANAITTKMPPQSQKLQGNITANLASISTTQGPVDMEPHSIHFERHIEMLRMLEFPEEHSRFQSFFAFSDLERAKDFAAGNKDAQIFKVEAESYEKRDMNFLNINSFPDIFHKGRKYWKGDSSTNPDWEILLEPPVEIIEKVELE